MTVMARKRPKNDGEQATPPPAPPDQPEAKPRYPSRDRVKYVGIPTAMYDALEQYAEDNSTEIDEKSISWAARLAILRFLTAEGRWPHRPKEEDE